MFIKNNRQYLTTLSAVQDVTGVKDDTGRAITVRKTVLTKAFPVFIKAPDTGSIMHTGYTAITEDEYQQLVKGSKFFRDYIKSGVFVKYEDAPVDALLDAQLIDRLQNDNDVLKARIAELEGQLLGVSPVKKDDKKADSAKGVF